MDSETRERVHIERVWGRLDEPLAESLRAFWQRMKVLDGAQAEARLPRVVSRLVDGAGRTVGTSSATPARVPAIANQWFLVYRCLLAEEVRSPERWMALLQAAWDVLVEEHGRGGGDHCIGVLTALIEPGLEQAWPQLIWPGTGFFHAGRTGNGARLRVRYFEDARIVTEGSA